MIFTTLIGLTLPKQNENKKDAKSSCCCIIRAYHTLFSMFCHRLFKRRDREETERGRPIYYFFLSIPCTRSDHPPGRTTIFYSTSKIPMSQDLPKLYTVPPFPVIICGWLLLLAGSFRILSSCCFLFSTKQDLLPEPLRTIWLRCRMDGEPGLVGNGYKPSLLTASIVV